MPPPSDLFWSKLSEAVSSIAGTLKESLDVKASLTAEIIKLGARIDALEKDKRLLELRVEELEGDLDKTGQQSLADIREENRALKADKQHWVRYVIGTIVALVVAVLMLLLGRSLGPVKVSRPEPPPSKYLATTATAVVTREEEE